MPKLIFLFLSFYTSLAFCAESGYVNVATDTTTARNIFWTKLPAINDFRGTVFFLAGGPQEHNTYLEGLAAAYQKAILPNYDFIFYDYYGLGQSTATFNFSLAEQIPHFTSTGQARDFITLKNTLVGPGKVIIMGGSYGAILGAQIVADYPDHIDRAILGWGMPGPGWLLGGWRRFDELLQRMALDNPHFSTDFSYLLKEAEAHRLRVTIDGENLLITRTMLEVSTWLLSSQEVENINNLPNHVRAAANGEQPVWLQHIFLVYQNLLRPENSNPVLNFQRCNVWLPKSERQTQQIDERIFLKESSLFTYWDQLCMNYDSYGEFPMLLNIPKPTTVPVFVWMGEVDHFDPRIGARRWEALSTRLKLNIMPGWAHDFGPDPGQGFLDLRDLILKFISETEAE